MRIALFADIHANREAFDACLAAAARLGAEAHVFLGDLVGYGADPAYVVDRVAAMAERGALVLLGNHDAAIAVPDPHMNAHAAAAIDWTRQALDRAQCAFLANLPRTIRQDDRLYVHSEASAPESWIYVTNVHEAERSLAATDLPFSFCGHIHVPQLYHQAPYKPALRFLPHSGIAIPLLTNRKWLAVIGSVGQPRDDNPAAAFALLDSRRGMLTYHRVVYDVEKAAQKIKEAGLPLILAARLFIGR
jgi:diadenosine tetraphosphatase ApaH/serine/threonine PP2A family protein phosphatase